MSAKMKKIVSAVVIIALLVVLGITWLKNRNATPETESTVAELSVETLSSAENATETETETEPTAETKTEEETSTKSETTTEAETSTELETSEAETTEPETTTEAPLSVVKDGEYSDKDSVALYIHTFGKLPSNYITKEEAEDLGWSSSKGNLWKVAKGKSIGGDYFGNYEGKLPKKSGRKYYECDIDFEGGYRNEKRIIYSNDGLVYYTGDHYETFEKLY